MDQDGLADLKHALAERAADLAQYLLGPPNASLSNQRELRYGRNGSLAIVLTGPKAGLFHDHETGEGGHLLNLIERRQNCGFLDAMKFAQEFCGTKIVRRPIKPQAQRPEDPVARRRAARRLWASRRPIEASPAETYLRRARGYSGPLASTLAYLPAHNSFPHALIAAFGIPSEREPGLLHIADVRGAHVTRLEAGGSDRVRDKTGKITIGACLGSPIACAPFAECNCALAIGEGVENALAAHAAMGIGAWAAGGASRLPALADAVPACVDAITIIADDDEAGHRHAITLARRLQERGFEVRVIPSFKGLAQ